MINKGEECAQRRPLVEQVAVGHVIHSGVWFGTPVAGILFFFCTIYPAMTTKYIMAPRALANPSELRDLWHILSDPRKPSYPSHQTRLYSPPPHMCPPSLWVEPSSLFIIETASSVATIPSLQTKYLNKRNKRKIPLSELFS
jgi:hypothetical protein